MLKSVSAPHTNDEDRRGIGHAPARSLHFLAAPTQPQAHQVWRRPARVDPSTPVPVSSLAP